MLLRPTLTFLMVGRAGVGGSLKTAARTSRVLFDGDLPLVSPAETFGSMDGAFSLPTGITGARRLPSGTTLEMMIYNRSGGVGKGVRGSTWYNGLFLTSYIYKVLRIISHQRTNPNKLTLPGRWFTRNRHHRTR